MKRTGKDKPVKNLRNMLLTILAVLSAIMTTMPARALELVMFEQEGCEWCARWNREIGVVYEKTPEGKRAPLRRVDIHEPMPRDLGRIAGSRFTPTFVLVDQGRELGRIRGYPGEDFFWGMLDEMLGKVPSTAPGAKATDASW